jgi:hypothetical protein
MKRAIEKIIGWLNRIPADKYKHFAVGTAVAAVVLLTVALFVPKWLALAASVVTVAVAAIGKEKADAKADEQDIIATFLGGLAAWITFLIG